MAIQVVKIREFNGHSQAVYTISKDIRPGYFYSGGGDGMLVRWHINETDGTMIARHDEAIYTIYNNDNYVFTGTINGLFTVFAADTFLMLKHLKLSEKAIFDIMAFNGEILVATGEGTLLFLDHEFNLLKTMSLSTKSLRKMVLTDEGLAVAGSEGIVWVLNRDLQVVSELRAQDLSVFALAYHSASKTILSGGRDATLKLYRNSQLFKTINAHLLHIHHISLNAAQTMYLTCSMDKTIKLWDADDDRLLKVIDLEKYGGHTSSVNKILWFDKNNFISCSDDRTLKCFEILEK